MQVAVCRGVYTLKFYRIPARALKNVVIPRWK
jgi:hypothetical protein